MALLAAPHPEGPSDGRPCDAEPFAGMEICKQQTFRLSILRVFHLTVIRLATALGGELDRH